jgi:hypothetical protein
MCLAFNPALAEKRLALVIGINDYQEVPKLEKAVGDAEAIAAKLATLGFQVSKSLNPDRRSLNLALAKLYEAIEPGDTVLVHYSGHGIEIAGQNYLLPADIPQPGNGQIDLLKAESLPLATLVETLGEKGAGVRILIVDACRDNPFAKAGKRSLGGTRGLGAVEPPKGTFIMYSAGTGQAALDRLNDSDASPTSVYTRVLLSRFDKPGMALRDLAASVREEVDKLSKSVGHEQRPAYYDDLPSDFSFSPSTTTAPADPATQQTVIFVPQVQVPQPSPPITGLSEEQAYKLSQSIDTVDAWNVFLSQYPAGIYTPYAQAAKEKLLALAEQQKSKPPVQASVDASEPEPPPVRRKVDTCNGYGRVVGLDPNGDNFLSVRTGPGSGFNEITRLYTGNEVSICSRSGKWLRVIYGAGAKGWVFGRYVSVGG